MLIKRLIWTLFFVPMFSFALDAHFDEKKVNHFIDDMVVHHHYDRAQLKGILNNIQYDDSVIRLMNRPYEAMPWQTYLRHFITTDRIFAGVQTWRKYRTTLKNLENQYHVPPAMIVAILGMESNYGRHQSTHQALRTLATLSFAYPKRSAFFTEELKSLFLLSDREHFDLQKIQGSYAGALGMPQFMPSNYLKYALDMDHHHHANLFGDMRDSMGSIAKFLNHFGWQSKQPVLSYAHFNTPKFTHLKLMSKSPKMKLEQIGHFKHDPTPDLMVLRLEDKDQEAWLAWPNFFALLHYNRSYLYALNAAVFSAYLEEAYEHAYG